jgi:chaperonin cofactor prefoldin
MLSEMRAIVSVLVGKALEGDTGAISVVLSKVMPSLKAQAEKVNFDLDTDAPASEQVGQVLDAIAQGRLAPDVGRLIIDSCKALAEVKSIETLEARIEALEQQLQRLQEQAAGQPTPARRPRRKPTPPTA